MTLMEKLACLSPLQKARLAAVADMDSLTAFAVINGIELTDAEKQQTLQYLKGTIMCEL